jgi:hypothetical protein
VVLRDRFADGDLGYLVNWYAAQCDGEWEHEYGIRIETLDNPGWSISIDLVGTSTEGRVLKMSRREIGNGKWITFESTGISFEASCDPLSLQEVVEEFRILVEPQ